MLSATPTATQDLQATEMPPAALPEIIETRLWLTEHDWLYGLLRSEHNVAPSFRFPDLISACVSLVFAHAEAGPRIFRFLGTELVLRPIGMPRRRESMWREQYERLLDLQRSPANRHPNPKFQLDQLTTACVALVRRDDPPGRSVLQQARVNMVNRAMRHHRDPPGRPIPPG